MVFWYLYCASAANWIKGRIETILGAKITVIIPAINEAEAIGYVLDEIPKSASEVIVVDNGSKDNTVAVAKNHGALVLNESRRGYGYACMHALEYIKSRESVYEKEEKCLAIAC